MLIGDTPDGPPSGGFAGAHQYRDYHVRTRPRTALLSEWSRVGWRLTIMRFGERQHSAQIRQLELALGTAR